MYFFTQAQKNVTITTPIFLAGYEKCTRIEELQRESPPKERKRGFRGTAFRTQRIERKIMPHQEFLR